jgi:outer membrane protein TolC
MRYILVYLLILLTVSISRGQEELKLEDAIKLGLAQNFDILIAQKNIEINSNNNTWGQAGRYPTIDINFQQGNNISDQSNNPTSFIQQVIRSHSLQSGLNLGWTLFNGFKVTANKEKLALLELQSEGNATLIIENTIQGIILSYYNAKLQLEKIALLKNVLELSKDKYDYQKVKQSLGTAVTVDLLQYETAYLTDSSSYIMQELAYRNSIRNLNLLMGVETSRTWNLSSKLTTEMPIFESAELIEKMNSNSTNLKNQLINLELSKQELKLAQSNLYPVVSFNLGAQNTNSTFVLGSESQGGSTLNYFGNFTLSFRLFDGGKIKRAIKNVVIQEEITNLNVEKTKLELSQELEIQLENYNARTNIFSINKRAFEASKKNLEIAHLKENSGLINSFNLRDIELAYLRAGVSLFDSMYAIIDSKTNLTKLTGGIIDN